MRARRAGDERETRVAFTGRQAGLHPCSECSNTKPMLSLRWSRLRQAPSPPACARIAFYIYDGTPGLLPRFASWSGNTEQRPSLDLMATKPPGGVRTYSPVFVTFPLLSPGPASRQHVRQTSVRQPNPAATRKTRTKTRMIDWGFPQVLRSRMVNTIMMRKRCPCDHESSGTLDVMLTSISVPLSVRQWL